MSDDREFWAATTDWLEAGSDRTPPQAVDAVLLAIRTTRQERVLWSPWRTLDLALFARVAIGAAAVLAVSVAAFALIPQGNNPSTAPTPSSTPTPTPALTVDGPRPEKTSPNPNLGSPPPLLTPNPRISSPVPQEWYGMKSGPPPRRKPPPPRPALPQSSFRETQSRLLQPVTQYTPVLPPPESRPQWVPQTNRKQARRPGGPNRDVLVGGYSGRAVDYTVTTDTTLCGKGGRVLDLGLGRQDGGAVAHRCRRSRAPLRHRRRRRDVHVLHRRPSRIPRAECAALAAPKLARPSPQKPGALPSSPPPPRLPPFRTVLATHRSEPTQRRTARFTPAITPSALRMNWTTSPVRRR